MSTTSTVTEHVIPATQRAITIRNPGKNAQVVIQDIPVPEPTHDDVLIRLSHTGVCHGDVSLIYGDWDSVGLTADESALMIPGHEGVGTVVKVGSNVKNFKVGDKAGVKWIQNTCRVCSQCLTGNDHYCGKQVHFGRTVPGSFQQYVVSPALYTSQIPDGVPDEQAGPIMCGGVTMYRGLKTADAKPGQWVVILGAGGGLGHLGVQYAKAMGLNVVAIDGGADKEKLCLSLGADVFLDFAKHKDIVEKTLEITGGGAAGVLSAAGNRSAYNMGARMLGMGGTLVCIGLPHESFDFPIAPLEFIQKGVYVTGTNAGSLQDVQEALAFAVRKQVRVNVETFSMDQAEDIFKKVHANKFSGRAVLDLR